MNENNPQNFTTVSAEASGGSSKNKKLLLVVGAAAVAIILAIVGFFLWQMQSVSPVQQAPPTPAPSPQPQAINNQQSAIDTSNWQTYRNDEFGFEMKFPENIWCKTTPSANIEDQLRINKDWATVMACEDLEWAFELEEDGPSYIPALFVNIIKSNLSPQEWIDENHAPDEKRIIKKLTINGEEVLQFDESFPDKLLRDSYFWKEPDTIFVITAYSTNLGTFSLELYDQILSTFRFVE